MATARFPLKEICKKLTCSICQDYFKDPVMIVECSHNFCRGCLAKRWGESEDEASCPLCKETVQSRSLRLNRQLANVVEKAKKLRLQDRKGGEATKEEAEERVCEEHWEPLKLFCQTDQVLLCLVCKRSKKHKNHKVIPAGEASQEYKDKIFKYLETLKPEREKILAYLADAENESEELLKITELERQKTVVEIRKLQQLLKEENCLLAQLEEVEKEIARRRDEHLTRLSEELSSLESLIREMEEKHQQPVTELLQDVRSTLQRCEQKEPLENLVAFPPELKWKFQVCRDIGPILGGVRKQSQDMLVSVLPMQKANVTLDPTTASKNIILSEDQRSIKCQSDAEDVPVENYIYGVVLGCEEFTGGCHFWDVTVGTEAGWAVGVAKISVMSCCTFTPKEGVWAVGKYNGKYRALIKDIHPPLPLSGELKRIHVCLNYDEGRLDFFDADAGTLLYTFSGLPFSGETLRPFFAVYDKGHLTLSSSDS